MNLIESNQLTMSSEQLCELLEIRHDNLRAKAFKMQSEGNLAFTENLGKGPGRPKAILYFDKRNSIVIAAKLNDELLTAVVDRWMELESKQPALPNFNDPVEAARAWADAKEGEQKALEVIEQQKPAVSFVADYVEASTGSKTFREVAKLLKENERELRAFLVDKKIMYKQAGTWYAYAQHQDAGRFEVKTGVKNGYSFNTTLFTAKGFTWLAGEIGKKKALAYV